MAFSIPTLYLWQAQNAQAIARPVPDNRMIAGPPQTDPASRVREYKEQLEARGGKVKYEHPEHREPERFKPAFGQVHERKRVDGPPDGRNHKELNDRQKHI